MAKQRKFKDRESILEEQNEKLKESIKKKDRVIRQKNRTIRQLKSEVKTAVDAFLDTEYHYRDINDSKTLSESLKEAKEGKARNTKERCPKCGSDDLKTFKFTGFFIKSCKCGYRNKFDEEQHI